VLQTAHAPKAAGGHDMGGSSASGAKADVDDQAGQKLPFEVTR